MPRHPHRGRGRPRRPSPHTGFFLLGATAGTVVALFLRARAEASWLLSYLGGVNAAMVLLYGVDKLSAKLHRLRVPERLLHLFALVGGTPGALLAQGLFRHKTVKRSFRLVFWLLAVLQCLVLAWALWRWRS